MASIGTFLLLFIVIAADVVTSEKSFVTVKCKPESVVQLGHPALLECSLQLSAEASDVNIRILTWKRKGEMVPVLSSIRGPVEMEPGYKLANQQWNNKNLNVSLLISATTVAHGGKYTCFVSTDSGDSEASVQLKVMAKYSQVKVYSIPEKIVENGDNMLVCESVGGYPQGQLRWNDVHGHDWTASAQMEAKKMENGCFNLSSRLPVLRGSTYFNYTCAVFTASGIKQAETTFIPLPPPPSPSNRASPEQRLANVVAPVLVIGSLIVGLLLALLVCRRRRAQFPDNHHHRQVCQEDYNVEEGDRRKMHE